MRSLFRLTVLAAVACGLMAPAAVAQSSDYPNRPIRVLVGFPPGGATDIVARLIGHYLSERLGQPIVVENRSGSGGNIAGAEAARAKPDGYTLLHGPDNIFLANPHIYGDKMDFDPIADFVPISSVVSNQLILGVHPSVKAQNMKEFVELVHKSKPPMLYASIGNGSMHHLAMEFLKQQLDLDMTHVPYRGGGPAGTALIAGEIQAGFGGGSLVGLIKAGKVRALGSTGNERSPTLPDVPTIGEAFPGYEVLIWHGWFAPKGTPQPIIDRLRKEIAAVLKEPDVREKLLNSGSGVPYASEPDEFAARIKSDNERFGKLIKQLGIGAK